jgi:hypothetical protein
MYGYLIVRDIINKFGYLIVTVRIYVPTLFVRRYKVEEAPKKSGTLLEGGVDDDASSKIIRYGTDPLGFHGDKRDSRSVNQQ